MDVTNSSSGRERGRRRESGTGRQARGRGNEPRVFFSFENYLKMTKRIG
jgi:hypothetical protein